MLLLACNGMAYSKQLQSLYSAAQDNDASTLMPMQRLAWMRLLKSQANLKAPQRVASRICDYFGQTHCSHSTNPAGNKRVSSMWSNDTHPHTLLHKICAVLLQGNAMPIRRKYGIDGYKSCCVSGTIVKICLEYSIWIKHCANHVSHDYRASWILWIWS